MASALLWLAGLAHGCADRASDCQWTLTCGGENGGSPDTGIGGSAAGTSGSGGAGTGGAGSGTGGTHDALTTGGTVATGGTGIGGIAMGGVGTGGVATGGAGMGGITSACDPACSGEKPVCNELAATCVECTTNGHCSAPKPACNSVANACVQCTANGDCSGATPVCNPDANVCVECLGDTNCSAPTPACQLASNTCVACTDDKHCPSATPACDPSTQNCVACTRDAHCTAAAPLCDTQKRQCVQCLDNDDCQSPSASFCSSGTCSPCTTNADCAHIAGKSVCNTDVESDPDAGVSAGTCVECTGTDYAACRGGDAGPGYVCDSLRNVCTERLEHSADLCQGCVSDAECKPGELCVEQKVNGKSLGHFCLWQQGKTEAGAPAVCGDTGRPYVSAVSAVSIDEQPATICTLRASTCTALHQYSQTSCVSPTNTPDDTLCGTLPGVDSKCAAFTTTQYRCTVACLSDDDCPPSGVTPITCNASGAYKFCSL